MAGLGLMLSPPSACVFEWTPAPTGAMCSVRMKGVCAESYATTRTAIWWALLHASRKLATASASVSAPKNRSKVSPLKASSE